ncbi:Uma2 family endonuclease [Streptomyces sp. XM4011]|uniref:Uma2 family endonuclease n=1 Tax=Streptomyces sp. XM4011 TaxID=2929780 RepID=UPI001FFAE3F5|nr:Uma2 family endonuclease [Streptomyces sp. XM4011]MCK1815152.1 Uma2 family endonuclease [Streptomyces sp. XM4011]
MTVTLPERDRSSEPRKSRQRHSDAERMYAVVDSTFDELNATAPEGWRVELIEGDIHVVPPANGPHEAMLAEMVTQVARHSTQESLRTYTGIGLLLPSPAVNSKVAPALVVAPSGSFMAPELYHDPEPVVLVGEITSESIGDNDQRKKLRGYARARIPSYLLVDRKAGTATLFGEPVGAGYRKQNVVPFSKAVSLPEPLGFDMDLQQFDD